MVQFGAHVFLLTALVGTLLMSSVEMLVQGALFGGDKTAEDAGGASSVDVTSDGSSTSASRSIPLEPVVVVAKNVPMTLKAQDVAFVLAKIESVTLPKTCNAPNAKGETKDIQMRHEIVAVLDEFLGTTKVQLTADPENAELQMQQEIIEKAKFLTERFAPDFSKATNPGLAYQKNLHGYLRRALLN